MERYLCKIGRRIQAWIDKESDGWHVHTGKPSDATCYGWGPFDTQEKAFSIAEKYMDNLVMYLRDKRYTIKEG